MKIGDAIREIRRSKGISQVELAHKIGVSANTMCQIEIGSTFPQKKTISLICEKLSVPECYLLFLSLEVSDVPEHKQYAFTILADAMKKLILEY